MLVPIFFGNPSKEFVPSTNISDVISNPEVSSNTFCNFVNISFPRGADVAIANFLQKLRLQWQQNSLKHSSFHRERRFSRILVRTICFKRNLYVYQVTSWATPMDKALSGFKLVYELFRSFKRVTVINSLTTYPDNVQGSVFRG